MPTKLSAKTTPAPSGWDWICRTCGEVCRVTWQDVGPYEGQEVCMEWRSDCCSAYVDERDMEAP